MFTHTYKVTNNKNFKLFEWPVYKLANVKLWIIIHTLQYIMYPTHITFRLHVAKNFKKTFSLPYYAHGIKVEIDIKHII